MATAVKNLTRMGGDVRKIARLLQKKAPEGHMLAYISPEEAELLKARGGSGKPHADTGIPSFENEGDWFSNWASTETPAYQDARADVRPSDVASGQYTFPTNVPSGDLGALGSGTYGMYAPEFGKSFVAGETPVAPITQPYDPSVSVIAQKPVPALEGYARPSASAGVSDFGQPAKPGFFEGLTKDMSPKESRDLLLKASLGLGQGILGARTARQAAQQGQAAKQELQALARPYQEKGMALQAQAMRGELTPQAMQSLQAAQAQAAQGVEKRGGVGAMQAQQQVEQFRQQLLAQQYDLGLKIANIGDQYVTGAIKTGLQADQYVNQLTGNYYGNIAKTLYGT